jgi:pseudouridine kinase
MRLTQRELQVLELLRRDPLLDAEAIARSLDSTRAAVHVHLSNLVKKGALRGRGYIVNDGPSVVVIGGANLDVKARSTGPWQPGTSNPGTSVMSAGGVGRNIAENIARLGTRAILVTSVGRDAAGETVLAETAAAGVVLDHVLRTDSPTGSYLALLDPDGELVGAVADMAATERLDSSAIDQVRDLIASASLVVVDGNLAPDTVGVVLDRAFAADVRVVVEPVSAPKAARLSRHLTAERPLYAITPNRDELEALTGLPTGRRGQLVAATDALHAKGVSIVWARLGRDGSLLSERTDDGTISRTDLGALPTDVADVTGAGDSMLGAFCHALLEGHAPAEAARYGHAAAALTVASPHTVRPDLTTRLLSQKLASS